MGGSGVQQSQGERDLADLSQAQWDDYKLKYQPLDKQMVARSQDKNRLRTMGTNMAAGGAGQAYDKAEAGVIQSMVSKGINPNSGRFTKSIVDMKRGRGTAVGKAGVGAEVETDKRYAGTMFNTIAHGRGVKGIGLNGINTTARISHNSAVSDAKFKAADNVAMMEAGGQIVGMAARAGNAFTAAGPNGSDSGWEAFSNAKDAGSDFGEAWSIARGKMQSNKY